MTSEKHNLAIPWDFWVIQKSKQYEIDPIIGFNTIEDFWQIYLQFPDIQQLKSGAVALFKKGIRPAWEDKKNENGVRVWLPQNLSKDQFEFLLAAMIGGKIDKVTNSKLSGLYINAGKNSAALWFQNEDINVEQIATILNLKKEDLSLAPINVRRRTSWMS